MQDTPSHPSQNRYPSQVREAAVRRYLTTATSYAEVAREFGTTRSSVTAWVEKATQGTHAKARANVKKRPDDRTPEEKFRLVLEALQLDGAELGALLRREGLHDDDLARWRADALRGLSQSDAPKGQSRVVRDLERKNKKTTKRLREAEALLDLQKKVHALWEDADDDTAET